jgi:hypothetical protein
MSAPSAPRTLSGGGRLGLWLGGYGWWIGTVLVSLPYLARLVAPLLGGFVLTLAAILAAEWLTRRSPHFQLGVWGTTGLACAAIGAYFHRVLEPRLLGDPEIAAHLHSIGANAVFPPALVLASAVVGALLLAAAWLVPAPRAG